MTARIRHTVLLVLVALGGLATAAAGGQFGFLRGSNRSTVTIRLEDGRAVTALVFDTNQKPSAVVILVPMLGRPKDDWQQLAERLVDASIMAVAIDLPGQSAPADAKELAAWHTAITGTVSYLAGRSDVRPYAIGVAGASLGANLAVLAAAADPRIRSLALVSPSLDYRGVRIEAAMKQYGDRPALLMASLKDPYAARSARELAATGSREMQWAETPAHGTALLAREPDLIRSLVEWFRRTLAVN